MVRRFSCGRRLRAAKTSDMVVGAATASDGACGEGRVTWRRRRGGLRDGAPACARVRRLSDGCAPRFAQRRGAPRRAVTAGRMHRWRGARVKLLTEATCLQDTVGRTWSAIYCAVASTSSRRTSTSYSSSTSTGGARDDELAVPENEVGDQAKFTPHAKNEQNLRGIPRFGAFRRREETLARAGRPLDSRWHAGSAQNWAAHRPP